MIKAYGIGRVVRDLELKTTQSNIPVVTFTLATDRQYKDADGEKQTDFISCVAWRALAENLVKYCSKGSKIFVEGRWTTRQYDTDDGTRYVNELVVDSCEFLDTKPSEEQTPRNSKGEFKAKDVKTTPPDDSLPF